MAKHIAKQEPSKFLVFQDQGADLQEIMEENLGGEGISQFDLTRVKIPSGGGTSWSIPTLEGDEDAKELRGIIVYWKNSRAYWKDSFGGGSNPPDCRSDDGVTGYGDPGGECNKCPLSQWGSDDRGKGQACKSIRFLFLLRENDILPVAIALPPTSIKPIKNYFLRLATSATPFYSVITTLRLEKTKNADGITYSVVTPSMERKLSPECTAKIKAYAENFKPALAAVTIQAADYGGEDVPI